MFLLYILYNHFNPIRAEIVLVRLGGSLHWVKVREKNKIGYRGSEETVKAGRGSER